MKTTFIYVLNDPRDGRMRYIGKADNPQERLRKHINTAKTNDYRGHWILALLAQGLKPELQILMEIPQEGWQEIERRFISVFKAAGMALVNTTKGGEAPPSWAGRKHSPETRIKMGAAQKGHVCLPETRSKIRAAHLGKLASPETKLKMSVARKGKTHAPLSTEARLKIGNANRGRIKSPETIAKLRAVWLGRKHSVESRLKMSAALKGRIFSPAHRAKLSAANRGRSTWSGRTHTLESRARMSAAAYMREQKKRDLQTLQN